MKNVEFCFAHARERLARDRAAGFRRSRDFVGRFARGCEFFLRRGSWVVGQFEFIRDFQAERACRQIAFAM